MLKAIKLISSDQNFLKVVKLFENLVSKFLAVAMLVVTLVAIIDLGVVLFSQLLVSPVGFINNSLIEIFGLFLNVLIALEILENITAYLRNHAIQLELVIVTSLTAVARKIIIFDSKAPGASLTPLALAILTLSISYGIIRYVNWQRES